MPHYYRILVFGYLKTVIIYVKVLCCSPELILLTLRKNIVIKG
jgi:hypothetical protein